MEVISVAESVCRMQHEYVVETVTLTGISGGYIFGNVAKDGYTPVGILSIDANGLASTQSLRLFFLQGTVARIGFNATITGTVTATVSILYLKT